MTYKCFQRRRTSLTPWDAVSLSYLNAKIADSKAVESSIS